MTKVDLNIALKPPFAKRYENYIGGEWRAPKAGKYFDNVSPITGQPVCEIARSDASDVEAALDAAHAAKDAWGKTSAAERAQILNKIADRIETNLEKLATAETWDNGKPIREAMAADLPLAIDHFRYFAGAIRAQEGSISEIDHDTIAYHFHEPLGVVGQIIPWNFPILMAVWKLAPALAAGNCVVIKPAEQTPASIMVLMEVIGDLLPKGIVNVVSGFGLEAGKPLASSNRIAKIAFTGETTTGRLIMQYASQNLIPVTLELGANRPTSSSRMWRRTMTTSSTRRSKASSCSRSIRARSAPVRAVRLSRSRSTTSSWSGRLSALTRSHRAARSIRTR
jgi:aldehyde dehydrogenase